MISSVICWRAAPEAINAGLTRYISLGASSVEADQEHNIQRRMGEPGFISHLAVKISANANTTDALFVITKDLMDTAQFVTVPAGLTGDFPILINTPVHFGAEDDIGLKAVSGAGGTISLQMVSVGFDGDNGTVTLLGCNSNGSSNAGGFFPVIGSRDAGATAALREIIVPFDCVWANLEHQGGNNDNDGITTVESWVNDAAGNQGVAIPAGAGGRFVDMSNADILVKGDRITVKVTLSGSGAFNTEKIYGTLTSANHALLGIHGNDKRVNGPATVTFPLRGEIGHGNADYIAPFPFQLSDLTVNCSVIQWDAQFKLLVDGVAGNQNLSFAAAGTQTDNINVDDITPSSVVYVQGTNNPNKYELQYFVCAQGPIGILLPPQEALDLIDQLKLSAVNLLAQANAGSVDAGALENFAGQTSETKVDLLILLNTPELLALLPNTLAGIDTMASWLENNYPVSLAGHLQTFKFAGDGTATLVPDLLTDPVLLTALAAQCTALINVVD